MSDASNSFLPMALLNTHFHRATVQSRGMQCIQCGQMCVALQVSSTMAAALGFHCAWKRFGFTAYAVLPHMFNGHFVWLLQVRACLVTLSASLSHAWTYVNKYTKSSVFLLQHKSCKPKKKWRKKEKSRTTKHESTLREAMLHVVPNLERTVRYIIWLGFCK